MLVPKKGQADDIDLLHTSQTRLQRPCRRGKKFILQDGLSSEEKGVFGCGGPKGGVSEGGGGWRAV